MNSTAQKVMALLLLTMLLSSCSKAGSEPATVKETSTDRPDLADRVEFLHEYVTFRRHYKKLDYSITYQNNGGGFVPGPSEWDIRLIAVVPKEEVEDWIPAGIEKKDDSPPKWLSELPGTIERDGMTEWYRKSGIMVGVDRERSIVAYRNTSMSE